MQYIPDGSGAWLVSAGERHSDAERVRDRGTDTGFAYDVLSDSYKGISLAEVSVYRPSAPLSYYEMRVGGVGVNMVRPQALSPRALAAPESGIVEIINYARGRDGLLPLWAGEGDMPTPAFICEAAS